MPVESIVIELGDKEYEISALPMKYSREWRQSFVTTLEPLLDLLPTIPDIEIDKPEELIKLVPALKGILTSDLDKVFELLFEYSEQLEEDREWIEENASDKQAFVAFVGVLKLTNPFEPEALKEVLSGQEKKQTSASSASASGPARRRSSKSSSANKK